MEKTLSWFQKNEMRHFYIFLLSGILISCSPEVKEILAHRREYKEEFLKDPRSPLQKGDLHHLEFFKPSTRAIVTARFVLTPDAQPFEMPTYSGITRSYRKYGEAKFLWGQDSVTLSVYQNLMLISNPVYKDYLFLPFKDWTNGVSTYGGGRYLDISKADTEDGMLRIDFNRSYNPWCAYSDGFNCPIPPAENHLQVSIEAGEKMYRGEIKH